jgi:hypothetical protein
MPAKSKTICESYESFITDFQNLYGAAYKVYGPYKRKQDGRKIVVIYDGVKRTAKLSAKVKLEIKLGKILTKKEEVDHIDGCKDNDAFNNLQLLTPTNNRIKQHSQKHGDVLNIKCHLCDKFIRTVYSNKRKIKCFCSNSCRSKFYGVNQFGNKIIGYRAVVKLANTSDLSSDVPGT